MAFITNAPLWVWLVLIFLLYKGIEQRKTRPIRLFQLFIFPAIFLPLTIIPLYHATEPLLGGVALFIGIVVGLFIGYLLWNENPLITKQNGQWIQQGSYLPLSLYLLIFIFRYAISVIQHLGSAIIQTSTFNILLGLPSGIGIGILLAIPLCRKNNNE